MLLGYSKHAETIQLGEFVLRIEYKTDDLVVSFGICFL
jgi:hypothetical protein